MYPLNLKIDACPEELKPGLTEIAAEWPRRFAKSAKAYSLKFERCGKLCKGGLSVAFNGKMINVRYGRKIDAFRALGRLLGQEKAQDFAETAKFDMLGIQFDVSRNGVLTTDSVRTLLRRSALMGINAAVLYAEDTYEVPGEPFFGYLRGRYTHEEMKGLDDYADALGIEMFPNIQALAHLEQILQWPAYAEYKDTAQVLLADDEKTYLLIEKMIAAASAPFRSKRIHLGMDEAHGIGSGQYKKIHGETSPFDILNRHLAKVNGICKKRGLKPMIWSDMYFRLGSENHDYYDKSSKIPPEVIAKIPKDVRLVYWDYYHHDFEFYMEWIKRHRALGSEPIVAPGIWTWGRFWTAMPFTLSTVEPCMRACKESGIREIFATTWGDDGMECDLFSALPGMQFYADHGYSDKVDQDLLRSNFRGSCDADYDDWCRASEIDSVPSLKNPSQDANNASKWILWQDIFLGVMDPQLEGYELRKDYEKLADFLTSASKKSPLSRRLIFPARIARAVAIKCELRRKIVAAYAAGDKKMLVKLMKTDLADLRKAVEELWKTHRDMWLATYKPFGLEVIEQRYGGQMARLESLDARLKDYVGGKILSIPEFETKLEKIFKTAPGYLPNVSHGRVSTASTIK
ncbi:MAG TPA: beta-N-acetylhexosaminidase [Lentisphaeria bacterium]|nr:MAG: hypothetical protein A2X45_07180 [Lentisphaerae bacterium GWF2_50_93]HCE43302.1 beta-N-acetylhexosaminidase [Lentisphaeria bacterium]